MLTLVFFSLPFWISLPFSFSRNSLRFWAVCPSFARILGVRQALEILAFLVVFLAVFQKGKEKKIRVGNPRILAHQTSLFSRARKKGFSFFPGGRLGPETVPKTQPLQVAFPLLERVDLRSQKEGILGKKIAWGRVGWTGQKKEKRMRKKRWETGNAKLSTTTAREQNRALGPQVYGRYPNPRKHKKSISTIAFAGSAKNWAPRSR